MQYNWYYKELKQKLKDLNKRKKSATGSELKLIEETIELIIDLLNYKNVHEVSDSQFLENDYLYLSPTSFMWDEVRKLAKLTSDDIILGKNDIPSIKLNDKDLVDLVHDFYKNGTDKRTYELFMKLFQTRKKNLHFMREDISLTADTVYLPFYQVAFIQVNRMDEFLDLTYTVHEFGHGIQFLVNYDSKLFDSIFHEVVSMFFELLAGEYFIKNGIFVKEGKIHQWESFDAMVESAYELKMEFALLDKIGVTPYENKNDLRTNINKYMLNNRQEVHQMNLAGNSSDYIYIVGLLIAVELFYVYLSDHEKAFYLLYKIIEIDPRLSMDEYYLKIQELGINLNEHTKDYQEYLKRRLK